MSDLNAQPHRLLNHVPVPGEDSFLVVPLGGTDRVGMNATLVGYGGSWLLVDVGATFAGSDDDRSAELAEAHGGVLEQIIPDFRAVARNFSRFVGIVLTHAHEDHVGGIPALFRFKQAWTPLTRLPIYATRYTQGIVRAKVEETGEKAVLKELRQRSWNRIGPFEVKPVRVTHSAPETCALAIRTPAGTIVLASDLKLDPEPVLGPRTDVEGLEMLGDAGVLAFLGDSTNAANAGRAASEGEVMRGLTEVMRAHRGRVVVSTFASNLARIVAVQNAAKASGRVLAGTGRSILRNVEIGQGAGVLSERDVALMDPRTLGSLAPGRAAMVCTGTQAEQGSGLSRMAADLETGRRPRGLALGAGDLLVHSARIIPGNEATVGAMFDTFRSHGVSVLEAGGDGPVIHASGHAKRDELADLYRMLRPRFAVPVHGHRGLIDAHLDLAASVRGVKAAISPREGEILRIAQDGVSVVGKLRVGQLATIAVGGRNAGETKLVPWDNAKEIGLSKLHAPQPSRGRQTREASDKRRDGQPKGRDGQGRRGGQQERAFQKPKVEVRRGRGRAVNRYRAPAATVSPAP